MHGTGRLVLSLLLVLLIVGANAFRPALDAPGCGLKTIQQIYETNYPERSCQVWVTSPVEVREVLSQPGGNDRTSGIESAGSQAFKDAPEYPVHKDLFPLSIIDVVGWLIACLTLFIAAGGGIGGGGVLVPLYILCWQFQTEHAVALSNLTIAGSAFANILCNIDRKHPTADRPLIYWDMILVMEPMTIVGAVAGGFLNKMLPLWLTTLLLCMLLFTMARSLWQKTFGMYHLENAAIALAEQSIHTIPESIHEDPDVPYEITTFDPLLQESSKELVMRLLDDHTSEALVAEPPSVPRNTSPTILADSSTCDDAAAVTPPLQLRPPFAAAQRGPLTTAPMLREARAILVHERQRAPAPTLIMLVVLFVWLVFTDMMKDFAVCGSFSFWALVFSIVPIVGAIIFIVRRILIHNTVVKQQVGIMPEKGDIIWTERTTLLYPLWCSCAGLIAGMFGVGGGIVKGPLMLHLGVLPEVAAATSATMILFTACSASVVYITFGGVKWDYAILMIVSGFAVTVSGQLLTYHIIERFGRRSVIVAAMAMLLSVGACIMLYEIFPAFHRGAQEGFFHTKSICA